MRTSIAALLILSALAACRSSDADRPIPPGPPHEVPSTQLPEETMSSTSNRERILYQRSGGIAGLVQSLEVIEGTRLSVKDRRLGDLPERELTLEEQRELERCLEEIAGDTTPGKPVAIVAKPQVSDTFQIAIYLGHSEEPALTARSPQLPITGAGAWDPLLAWLDARLREALEGGSKNRYRIESVE